MKDRLRRPNVHLISFRRRGQGEWRNSNVLKDNALEFSRTYKICQSISSGIPSNTKHDKQKIFTQVPYSETVEQKILNVARGKNHTACKRTAIILTDDFLTVTTKAE